MERIALRQYFKGGQIDESEPAHGFLYAARASEQELKPAWYVWKLRGEWPDIYEHWAAADFSSMP